ncbi:MAG: TrkA C-terminal domain-containing protein, partial [Dehalococcoidia bacterium]
VEIQLPDRGGSVGKALKDVYLPQGSLIILLVDTEGTPRLPTTESVLRANDEVIAITRGDTEEELRTVLTGQSGDGI